MIRARPWAGVICALVAGPGVLALELWRRAGALAEVRLWLDDAIGAAFLVGAAVAALRDPARSGLLALAWAFAAGQLTMSLLGQLGHAGPDPSGQPFWLVVAGKAVLLAGAATLAMLTLKQGTESSS